MAKDWIDRFKDTANLLLRNSEYKSAQLLLESCCKTIVLPKELYSIAIEINEKGKRLDDALHFAAQWVKNDINSKDAWLSLARICFSMKIYELTEHICYLASLCVGDEPELLKLYIEACSKLGHKDNVVIAYSKLITIQPNKREYYQNYITFMINEKQYDYAEELCLKSIEKCEANPDIMVQRAVIYLYRHEYMKALDLLKPICKQFPKYEHVYARMAQAYLGLCEYEKAEQQCMWCMEKHPKNFMAHKTYADIAMHKRDFEEADIRWRNVRFKFPKRKEGYLGGSLACIRICKYDEAELIIKRGLESFPNQRNLLLNWIEIAKRQRNFSLAQTRLNSVRKIYPDLPANIYDADVKLTRILANPYFNIKDRHKVTKRIMHIISTNYFKRNFHKSEFTKSHMQTEEQINDYLEKRVDIYVKFCMPSVTIQLGERDRWLLIVSDQYKHAINNLLPALDERIIIVNEAEYKQYYRLLDIQNIDYVNSIRLDNDDAISFDYLEISSHVIDRINSKQGLLIFPHGLQYNDNTGLGPCISSCPHFVSLFTDVHSLRPVDVFRAGDHGLIYTCGYQTYSILTDMPMWVENIHDSNQMNFSNSYGSLNSTEYLLASRFNIKIK